MFRMHLLKNARQIPTIANSAKNGVSSQNDDDLTATVKLIMMIIANGFRDRTGIRLVLMDTLREST